MKKLNQNAINDVLKTKHKIRAEVIFKFLVEGKSHRKIELEKPELVKNDGWSSWKITQFYGFTNHDKGKFNDLEFENILNQTEEINLEDFAEFHLKNEVVEKGNASDSGKDILRLIKTRVGQSKLRNQLLLTYEGKCALCDIDEECLLITSHIKPWSKSSPSEKVDLENTILLCKLHDGMFDKGLISFDDDYRILFKDKTSLDRQGISTGINFREPIRKNPKIEYLRYHRKENKIKISQ